VIRLKLLSGKTAGTSWVARRFPVRIGRSSACDLRFEAEGVWERHFELEFLSGQGIAIKAHLDAPTRVNGEPVEEAMLRNGDIIEFGCLRTQFWLSDTSQIALRLRETLFWTGLTAITLVQLFLIYWLLR
jgi:hypothetical protein